MRWAVCCSPQPWPCPEYYTWMYLCIFISRMNVEWYLSLSASYQCHEYAFIRIYECIQFTDVFCCTNTSDCTHLLLNWSNNISQRQNKHFVAKPYLFTGHASPLLLPLSTSSIPSVMRKLRLHVVNANIINQ